MQKKQFLIGLTALLSLPISAKVTLDDVYKAEQSAKLFDWGNNYRHMQIHNRPLNPSHSNTPNPALTAIRVLGNDAGRSQTSWATCPAGSVLSGGGYQLIHFGGGGGYNAPDQSLAEPANNRWVVVSPNANRTFRAVATCIRI